jgi:hypothetical protein
VPRSASRPWLLKAGRPHRVGRLQRQIRRAFVSSNGRPLTIGELLGWCYAGAAHHPRWHTWDIHRSLPKVAEPLGRIPNTQGRAMRWSPKPELLRLIAGGR